MNWYLEIKMPSFGVANLRNGWRLRAIRALNLNTLIAIYAVQNKSEIS